MLAAVLLALLVLPAGTAHADVADRADALGLDVTVGLGGHDARAAWQPLSVTLAPDEPVRGRIVVAAGSGGDSVVLRVVDDVEVAAGTTKRWHLLVPPSSDLRVQVVEDGSDRASTVTPARRPVDGVLVTTLGSVEPGDLPAVTLPQTDQRVQVVTAPEDVLALGERALDAVGALVVRQADLAAMHPDLLRIVTARVADGATLVVLEATDPDLGLPWRAATAVDGDGLEAAPGAWAASTVAIGTGAQPRAATDLAAVAAGRGRLVVTTLDAGSPALADARPWEHLLQPAAGTPPTTDATERDLPGLVEQAFGDTVGNAPSIGWLVGFFAVYVLVAGPVVGVVLSRRRRPELAWVVLPVVTAVFAVAAVVGATGARPSSGAAAEVSTWVDGVGTTTAVAGVRAPRAGDHTIALPGVGWDVRTASWSSTTRVTEGSDTTMTLNLPGQSFGGIVAQRPTTDTPPLDVEVAVLHQLARVEVTNVGDRDLAEVRLRLGTAEHRLAGALPAGETLVDEVALREPLPSQHDPFGGPGPGVFDEAFDALPHLLRWDVLDRAPGLVWVLAEDPLAPMLASVDGNTPDGRGRLVAVGATPPVTDDATTPYEVQRDLVAVGADTWVEQPLTVSGTGPATLRFRLPAEGTLDGLDLALDRGCCVNGFVAPAQGQQVEACGVLEERDAQTGALVRSTDVCSADPPCPDGAVSCGWSVAGDADPEGEACYEDRPCTDLRWLVERPAEPAQAAQTGMQVWDHLERRWVEAADAEATIADGVVAPWVGPLGDVWVRAVGELSPLDVAPQSVSATLRQGDA